MIQVLYFLLCSKSLRFCSLSSKKGVYFQNNVLNWRWLSSRFAQPHRFVGLLFTVFLAAGKVTCYLWKLLNVLQFRLAPHWVAPNHFQNLSAFQWIPEWLHGFWRSRMSHQRIQHGSGSCWIIHELLMENCMVSCLLICAIFLWPRVVIFATNVG